MAKPQTEDPGLVEQPASMHDAAAILAGLNIEELLKGQLDVIVEQRVAQEVSRVNAVNKEVQAETRVKKAVVPKTYLTHWRCDTEPNIVLAARTIVDGKPWQPKDWTLTANGKIWKDPDPLHGLVLRFRRGHFFSTEQWQDDFLEWKMTAPIISTVNPDQIIGGNPSIYKDDGNNIGQCPHCGEPFIPGSAALKAHLRAVHGIV